ncbi:hypothetical protein N6H14_04710 [Paenibacillus sp. CC-CFT747]|nr:hypothetical protein N6H14_04710 [Paenibacillus sp. CC-CFT747]
MRELATVENAADGSKQAALHLEGRQVPALVNAIGSMLVAHASGDGAGWHGKMASDDPAGLPWGGQPMDLSAALPKLKDKIKVETVALDAGISPTDMLTSQKAEIHVTGNDEEGKPHELVLRVAADFSDLSTTTPDRVDLTGKTVEEIKKEDRKWGWKH